MDSEFNYHASLIGLKVIEHFKGRDYGPLDLNDEYLISIPEYRKKNRNSFLPRLEKFPRPKICISDARVVSIV